MNDKDKQIVKDSALAAADGLIGLGGLNIPWSLCKAYFGVSMKIRQKKALEFVEMIRDNPSVFIESVVSDEKFQDGFVVGLEEYLKERNKTKREIMKRIFLGFATSGDKEWFELERLYNALGLLNQGSLAVLRGVDVRRQEFHQIYEGTTSKNENIYDLINAGILLSDYSSRFGPIKAPFVMVTNFGRKFMKYIDDETQDFESQN